MDLENLEGTQEEVLDEGAGSDSTEQTSEDTSSQDSGEQTEGQPEGEKEAAKATEKPAKEAAAAQSKQTTDSKSGAAQSAFVPNFKYKVAGKEQDIPKEFQALIKDEKTQKQIQKLFEDAHGIEPMKQSFVKEKQELSTKLGEISQEVSAYREKISYAAKAYQDSLQEGKIHRFEDMIRALNISEEQLMKYAVYKAQMAQLPPEQRAMAQAQIQAERDKQAALEAQSKMQEQTVQATTQAKQMEFNYYMSHPTVNAYAQELDGKFGKEGTFTQEVINTGKLVYATEGRNLSVPEAIQMVAQKWGLTGSPSQAAGTQGGTGGAATVTGPNGKPVVQKTASTIPNVGGSGAASPVGSTKSFKTTAEMRKAANERVRKKLDQQRA